MNGSLGYPSPSNSCHGDSEPSLPDYVDLQVVLPSGEVKVVTTEYGKQLLDLLVQQAAAHKLSPAAHTINIYNEETGRAVEYTPSQTVGSLYTAGITTLHLVDKRRTTAKPPQTKSATFEKTQRLVINLPRGQKMLQRLSPRTPLADVFKLVCQEKGLDPYKHELRHPSRADVDLNMARCLADYSLAEVTVATLTGEDVPAVTLTSSSVNPAEMGSREDFGSGSYMPGMGDKKKKNKFLSFFSKKKDTKFKVSETTYNAHQPNNRHSYAGPGYSSSSLAGSSHMTVSNPALNSQQPLSIHQPQRSQSQKPLVQNNNVKVVPPKPPRKKRPAPPPPPAPSSLQNVDSSNLPSSSTVDSTPASLTVDTTVPGAPDLTNAHSRTSSHSSGFESASSPLESPSSSSRDTETGAKNKMDIRGDKRDMTVIAEVAGEVQLHQGKSPSQGAAGAASLPKAKSKKKRTAPPPPPAGGSPAPSAISSEFRPSNNSTPIQDDDASADGASTGAGVIDSNSNSKPRPCQFVAPPPPASPPPSPQHSSQTSSLLRSKVTAEVSMGSELCDSSTQVHVTTRDSLSSEAGNRRSDFVTSFVDQMTELTEHVDKSSLPRSPDQSSSSPRSRSSSAAVVEESPSAACLSDVREELALPAEDDPVLLAHTTHHSRTADRQQEDPGLAESQDSGIGAEPQQQHLTEATESGRLASAASSVEQVRGAGGSASSEWMASVSEITHDTGEIRFDNDDVMYVDPTHSKHHLSPETNKSEDIHVSTEIEDSKTDVSYAITPPIGFSDEMPDFQVPDIPAPKKLSAGPITTEPAVVQPVKVKEIDSDGDSIPDVDEILAAADASLSSSDNESEPEKMPVRDERPKLEEKKEAEQPAFKVNSLRDMYKKAAPARPQLNYNFVTDAASGPKYTFTMPQKNDDDNRIVIDREHSIKAGRIDDVDSKAPEPYGMYHIPGQRKIYAAKPQERVVIKPKPVEHVDSEPEEAPQTEIVLNDTPKSAHYSVDEIPIDVPKKEPEVILLERSDREFRGTASVMRDSQPKKEVESLRTRQKETEMLTLKKEPEVLTIKKEPEVLTIKKEPEVLTIRREHDDLMTKQQWQEEQALEMARNRAMLTSATPKAGSKTRILPVYQHSEEASSSRISPPPPVAPVSSVQQTAPAEPVVAPPTPPAMEQTEFERRLEQHRQEMRASNSRLSESRAVNRNTETSVKSSAPISSSHKVEVSRQTQPMTAEQLEFEKRIEQAHSSYNKIGNSTQKQSSSSSRPSNLRLLAPRGWNAARNTSEPSVRDVRKALDMHQKVGTSAMETATHRQTGAGGGELTFSPAAENEQESVLEDKSLTLMSNNVQRKSILKNPGGGSRHYGSAMTLATSSDDFHVAAAKTNSSDNLAAAATTRPTQVRLSKTPSMSEVERERRKKTLQTQYQELQSQFSRWQAQLVENQALLAAGKTTAPEDSAGGGRRKIVPQDEQVTRRKIIPNETKAARPTSWSMTERNLERTSSLNSQPSPTKETVDRSPSFDSSSINGRRKIKPDPVVDVYSARESLLAEIRMKTPKVDAHESSPTVAEREVGGTIVSPKKGYVPRKQRWNDTAPTSPVNAGLAGKFSPDELLSAKGTLRQNSMEEIGSTMRFNANGTSSKPTTSTYGPREGSPTSASPQARSWSRAKSPVSPVGTPPPLPSSPPPMAPPPPPPTQNGGASKFGSKVTTTKAPRPSSRFEPKLDPREELMIAIRSAGGRGGLRKVSSQDTHWSGAAGGQVAS